MPSPLQSLLLCSSDLYDASLSHCKASLIICSKLGAMLFGLASDRWGRKYPLAINLVIVAALELATGFVQDFGSFLAVRSLFGIGMCVYVSRGAHIAQCE
jgi:MFS family permease